MNGISRYTVLGVSVLLIAGVFLFFSDTDNIGYDHTGIVSDVRESTNGYTFHLHDSDRNDIRCFSYEEPVEMGYYAVSGEFSDDGNIFFVSTLRSLDIEPLPNMMIEYAVPITIIYIPELLA